MKSTATQSRSVVDAQVRARSAGPLAIAARIKAGLPVKEFDRLREHLGLSVEALSKKIDISTATLSRRRQSGRPLDAQHSDRLIRFARLFRLATALYDGDAAAARRWLSTAARALGGLAPLDVAETEAGAREVERLIGRLEHGVYT